MRSVFAFLFGAVAAYALSFAIDLLAGGLLGVYSTRAFLPVITWSLIAAVAQLLALYLAPRGRFLILPGVAISVLALFGGIVGRRHDFFVCAALLAQAYAVYRATQPERASTTLRASAPGA